MNEGLFGHNFRRNKRVDFSTVFNQQQFGHIFWIELSFEMQGQWFSANIVELAFLSWCRRLACTLILQASRPHHVAGEARPHHVAGEPPAR